MLFASIQEQAQYWWVAVFVALFFLWQILAFIHKREPKDQPWWVISAATVHFGGLLGSLVVLCVFAGWSIFFRFCRELTTMYPTSTITVSIAPPLSRFPTRTPYLPVEGS